MKTRIVLVDDHRVVRQGLRNLLESYPDLQVVGSASSGEEALANLTEWSADVVVVDLLMPGGMDGLETTRQIRQAAPRAQVVVLTAYADDARVVAALRMGAIGYVRKDAEPEVLRDAVRAAARGRSFLDPAITDTVLLELARGGKDELTEREQDVLKQLAHGRTNREIAEALVVSEETVKTHVGNSLAKLHLAHRMQAALYALKQGLVSLDEISVERDGG
jgi:two-component system, NarL family, response regulator LiaR